jgi:hypothetical protein
MSYVPAWFQITGNEMKFFGCRNYCIKRNVKYPVVLRRLIAFATDFPNPRPRPEKVQLTIA